MMLNNGSTESGTMIDLFHFTEVKVKASLTWPNLT